MVLRAQTLASYQRVLVPIVRERETKYHKTKGLCRSASILPIVKRVPECIINTLFIIVIKLQSFSGWDPLPTWVNNWWNQPPLGGSKLATFASKWYDLTGFTVEDSKVLALLGTHQENGTFY